MCDYSLAQYNNRLANVGETLVATRFPIGCMGFTAAMSSMNTLVTRKRSLRALLSGNESVQKSPLCAVCLPPGARLRLIDIDEEFQTEWNVSSSEEVKFVQVSANANIYRDAVEFANGRRVSLQDLPKGLEARVMSLESLESTHEDTSEAVLVARR